MTGVSERRSDKFIVGTGRCGSTLLSRMLAEHPSLLMIFEFFSGLDRSRRFADGAVDAEALAALLREDTPVLTMVMKRGYEIAEVVYPFDAPGSRYRREGGLPWIAAAALARMSDRPDALFDETIAYARSLPTQSMAEHYRCLYGWLTSRMDRALWIEKSGSSIEYLAALAELFPGARFLHLHRDGREAALSMREHHVYRLWVQMTYGAEGGAKPASSDIASSPSEAQPAIDDQISRMLAAEPAVEQFGRYWSDLTVAGFSAVDRLGSDRYRELSFERLVEHPQQVLTEIAEFFELPQADLRWVDSAAALVRGAPATRYDRLPKRQREALDEACRPGRMLLGQVT